MKLNKFFSLFLAVILVLFAAGCGNDENGTQNDGSANTDTVSVTQTEAVTPADPDTGNAEDVSGTDGIASPEPADAAEARQIEVVLVGGTGRVSIQSPAALLDRDGAAYAEIVWSSPNYSYMLVDGEKYMPVNTEGNSTFVIPVTLDVDMAVIACTTAMSAPREVEYTLHFNSESIQ